MLFLTIFCFGALDVISAVAMLPRTHTSAISDGSTTTILDSGEIVAKFNPFEWTNPPKVLPSSTATIPEFNDQDQPTSYLDLNKIPLQGIPTCSTKDYPTIQGMYGPCFKIIAVILDGCEAVMNKNLALTPLGYSMRQRHLRISVELLFSPKTPSKYDQYEQDTRNKISEFARNAGYDSPQRWATDILPKQVRKFPKNIKDIRQPEEVNWKNTSKSMQNRENADMVLAEMRNKASPSKNRKLRSSSEVPGNTIQFIPYIYKESRLGKPSKMMSRLHNKSPSNVIS